MSVTVSAVDGLSAISQVPAIGTRWCGMTLREVSAWLRASGVWDVDCKWGMPHYGTAVSGRCRYCGRRVVGGAVCRGCVAVI